MSSARGWWIGLGALLLAQVVTPAWPVAAQEMAHPHAEGDDDDRPFPEGPLSDADYATALHLVLGHLDVGEELVAQGAWNDALPHFAHPAEELYPVIGPELARRGAGPFDKELDALLQRVKAHDAGAGFAEADRALRAKVTAARGAIPPATTDGAGFAAEVVVGLVHFAAGEYEEAFADGRLVAPVEYQDGRGFVTEAKRLVKDREAALAQADPARLKASRSTWPRSTRSGRPRCRPRPRAATRTGPGRWSCRSRAMPAASRTKGGVAALLVLLALGPAAAEAPAPDDLGALKARFARPATVPFPADDPYSAAKVGLGRRLFDDPSLSRDGRVACASCHDAAHAFADPRPRSLGVTGRPTARHAPPLLDLAWARTLFWDGRAPSLETQVRFPVEHPDEMGERLGNVAGRLAADPGYAAAFAAAFPDEPRPSERTVPEALATFERTLLSPVSRFDRWVAGDGSALSDPRSGASACSPARPAAPTATRAGGSPTTPTTTSACRTGTAAAAWRWACRPPTTRSAPPSLREVGRTGPYMHDGSLPDLAAVLDHYERGIVERPTLSPDLPRISLTPDERADLLAFLGALTADDPSPPPVVPATADEPLGPVATAPLVMQRNKRFAPDSLRLPKGATLQITNDDTRTHNVRVHDPALEVDSGAQEPGQTVAITFRDPGTFWVVCGIHPAMRLKVEVDP